MSDQPKQPRTRPQRTRLRPHHIVAGVLLVTGLALLIVCLKATDLGLATNFGPSWTQVITGVLGTALTATGLAIVVQPFTPPPGEPH